MVKGKRSVLLWCDQLEDLYGVLSDEQIGRLHRSIVNYVLWGEPVLMDAQTEMVWRILKPSIDRDEKKYAEKYAEMHIKRSEAGTISALSKASRKGKVHVVIPVGKGETLVFNQADVDRLQEDYPSVDILKEIARTQVQYKNGVLEACTAREAMSRFEDYLKIRNYDLERQAIREDLKAAESAGLFRK